MKIFALIYTAAMAATTVQAQDVVVYSASLSGAAEVPPVETDVGGSITLMTREGSTGMLFNLKIDNPSGVPLLGAAGAHVSTYLCYQLHKFFRKQAVGYARRCDMSYVSLCEQHRRPIIMIHSLAIFIFSLTPSLSLHHSSIVVRKEKMALPSPSWLQSSLGAQCPLKSTTMLRLTKRVWPKQIVGRQLLN